MPGRRKAKNEPHVYGKCGIRCFYCGIEATCISDRELAFFVYRQFSVEHIVPRGLFPSNFLEPALRKKFPTLGTNDRAEGDTVREPNMAGGRAAVIRI